MNPADSHGHCPSPVLQHKSFWWAFGSKEQLIKAKCEWVPIYPCFSPCPGASHILLREFFNLQKGSQEKWLWCAAFLGSELKKYLDGWKGNWACSTWPCLEWEGECWLYHLQRSPPASTLLWFCEYNCCPTVQFSVTFIGKLLVPTLAQFRVIVCISCLWLLWFCLSLWEEREFFSPTRWAGSHLYTAEYWWSLSPGNSLPVCSSSPVFKIVLCRLDSEAKQQSCHHWCNAFVPRVSCIRF